MQESKNKNDRFPDYNVISGVKRDEVVPGSPLTFEIVDYTNDSQKEIIEVGGVQEPPQKIKKGRKKTAVVPVQQIPQEVPEEAPQESVVFKTDVLETEVRVSYVHEDDFVVCLFYPESSPIKVRPKKGTSFVLEIEGRDIPVYSPGVYIPAPHFKSELAFFLVSDSKED
jgi:hypothetical protein